MYGVPRALKRLCASHRAFQEWKVRGTQYTPPLMILNEAECEMQIWTRFCETILRERIRKTETNVF